MNQPEKRSDIFISHISEESVIAKTLKAFLQRIFSNDIDIFVSSDYSSVSGGDFWFTHIIEQLRLSQVVLVLISKDSAHRASVLHRFANFSKVVRIYLLWGDKFNQGLRIVLEIP
jgi:hypothetical protein